MSRACRILPVVALLLFVAPASAGATVVYETSQIGKVPRIVVANDDGSPARALSTAGLKRLALPLQDPRISPDGSQLVALDSNYQRGSVVLLPTDGGPPRVVFTARQVNGAWWSPTGSAVAIATQRGLYRLDLPSGAATRIAQGAILDASFSPAGDLIAYDVNRGRRSNVAVVPTQGGPATALTTDGRSSAPVFGPGAIAYQRYTRAAPGSTAQIWIVAPDGSGNRQLTSARLRTGNALSPVAWSTRLVASLGSTGISFAWSVNPADGASTQIGDYAPTAISKDGSTVLGQTGGTMFQQDSNVVVAPYAGGRPTVIARHAINPDWNR
jgi:hypothetical protein